MLPDAAQWPAQGYSTPMSMTPMATPMATLQQAAARGARATGSGQWAGPHGAAVAGEPGADLRQRPGGRVTRPGGRGTHGESGADLRQRPGGGAGRRGGHRGHGEAGPACE